MAKRDIRRHKEVRPGKDGGLMAAVQYEGRIDHTEDSIHALFNTQYNTYHLGRVVLTAVAGVALVAAGLFAAVPMWGQGLLLLAGCLLFVGRDFPATLQAENALDARHGALPSDVCTFFSGHMELREGDAHKKLRYEQLDRLVSDKKYLYLFLGPQSVIMVDKEKITPGTAQEVMDLVAKRSGKRWEAPVSLLTMNLADLLRAHDRRKRRKKA